MCSSRPWLFTLQATCPAETKWSISLSILTLYLQIYRDTASILSLTLAHLLQAQHYSTLHMRLSSTYTCMSTRVAGLGQVSGLTEDRSVAPVRSQSQ